MNSEQAKKKWKNLKLKNVTGPVYGEGISPGMESVGGRRKRNSRGT